MEPPRHPTNYPSDLPESRWKLVEDLASKIRIGTISMDCCSKQRRAASVQDRDATTELFARARSKSARFEEVLVDFAYAGEVAALAASASGVKVEIVKRSDERPGVVSIPKRWVVERTSGWFSFDRVLARDYEHTTVSAEGSVQLAGIDQMMQRWARRVMFDSTRSESSATRRLMIYSSLFTHTGIFLVVADDLTEPVDPRYAIATGDIASIPQYQSALFSPRTAFLAARRVSQLPRATVAQSRTVINTILHLLGLGDRSTGIDNLMFNQAGPDGKLMGVPLGTTLDQSQRRHIERIAQEMVQ